MRSIDTPGQWVCHTCGHTVEHGTAGVRCPVDALPLIPRAVHQAWPDDAVLGRVIGGKYAIVGVVGRGGMGVVYHAVQEPVGREVAVKVIRTKQGEEGNLVRARFFREAKVIARLRHEATVTLHDYGEEDDGLLYIVLEYIEGRSLYLVRERLGRFPAPRLVNLIGQVLGSLAEAHSLGIVHRDLKPANLMLTTGPLGRERVKVLDFGVAKIVHGDIKMTRELSLETGAGLMVGTPRYMSPEQVRTKEVDGRADLYSLGVILYEMLTGAVPFDGASSFDICLGHIEGAVPPFPEAAAVPPALQAVVRRALAKRPEDRYVDAGAMAQALLEAVPEATPDSILGAVASTSVEEPGHDFPPPDEGTLPGSTSAEMRGAIDADRSVRPSALLGWGVAGAMTLAGALAWLLWQPEPLQPAQPPSTDLAPEIIRRGAPPRPQRGTVAPARKAAAPGRAPYERAVEAAGRGEAQRASVALAEAIRRADDPEALRDRARRDRRFGPVRAHPGFLALLGEVPVKRARRAPAPTRARRRRRRMERL